MILAFLPLWLTLTAYPLLLNNGSGSADMAHDEHQIMTQQVLDHMPERFIDGENYCWIEFKGGTHAYNCWLPHLYNCLRVFFQ